MEIVAVFGLLLILVPAVKSVTEDDVKECGSYIFGRVLCTSVNSFYRECIVPGATAIDLIKLHRNMTREPCHFADTFGFRGNAVWVNEGCSGEFYVCYEGVRVSTDYPVLTVPVTPNGGKTVKPDVAVGSTSGGGDDVVLYIVIVVVLVLLMMLALLVGCYVKRRQHRDRSRRLAEKRQASIDQRAHKTQIEENTSPLPMATRSLSLESLRNETSTSRTGSRGARDNTGASFEQDGSVCSSQSNMSEFTSVSAQTAPANMDNFRQLASSAKRGSSSSDITPIGTYSDIGSISKQNRNVSSCHSSLESIREVCNKYKMVDIPIERRYKKKSEHSNKYSTMGFSYAPNIPSVKSGTMTLPVKRTKTRALVHVNPPHVPPKPDRKLATGSSITSFEQHYHDPEELSFNSADETRAKIMGSSLYEECFPGGSDDKRLSTELDEEYAIVGTCVRSTAPDQNTKSTVLPIDQNTKSTAITDAEQNTDSSHPIYATVAKSCLKPKSTDTTNSNGNLNVSFEERHSQKKEANNNVFTIYGGREYGPLHSFRPVNGTDRTVDVKGLPMDVQATKC